MGNRGAEAGDGAQRARTDLGAQVEAGLDGAAIVFGPTGSPLPAATLAERGLHVAAAGDGGTVAAVLTNDQPSVELLLGAIVGGTRLVSVPYPARAADPVAYGAFVQAACQAHGVSRVVVRDDLAPLLDALGVATLPHSKLEPGRLDPGPGFELVQFTSGSTGTPRGVVIDGDALGVNMAAMLDRLGPEPGDATVTWLPLSHDMGLLGTFLSSIIACSPDRIAEGTVVLLPPEDFLRSPGTWLEVVDTWKGTFTGAPDFGYRLAMAKRPSRRLDLRQLRCAVIGGEIVRAETLRAVAECFARDGLSPTALSPAYGMAELGVAAAITPARDPWRAVALDPVALGDGRRAAPAAGGAVLEITASGPPLAGYAVGIEADPGQIGPITVDAPVVGRDADGRSLAGPDGILRTADVGFVDDDGWLYVCGRRDDHIVTRGRNLHAPAIEGAMGRAPGVRSGRVTAIGTPEGEWVVAAESAESGTTPAAEEVRKAIRRAAVEVAALAPDHVVLVPPGQLPMTSSGKVQRHEVLRRWLDGSLAG